MYIVEGVYMYCGKCGNVLQENEKFCSKCGTARNSKTCIKCGNILQENEKFCSFQSIQVHSKRIGYYVDCKHSDESDI